MPVTVFVILANAYPIFNFLFVKGKDGEICFYILKQINK